MPKESQDETGKILKKKRFFLYLTKPKKVGIDPTSFVFFIWCIPEKTPPYASKNLPCSFSAFKICSRSFSERKRFFFMSHI